MINRRWSLLEFKTSSNHLVVFGVALMLFLFNYQSCYSELKTYSSPGDLSNVPHLKESTDYTVKVNGESSFVYESDNSWDGDGIESSRKKEDKASFTNFDFKNESVTVEVTCNFTVNSLIIRPKNDSISFTQIGNTISFTLSKSKYLSIEVNDRLRPLFIFADSLETAPNAAITYGPGIHNIGTKFQVSGNQTIYIAGGAVVVGSFYCSGNNLKICGRGILNCGSVLSAEWDLDHTKSPLAAVTTLAGYELNGFTIVNSPGWHVNAYGSNTKFINLKCIAWAGLSDGPHLNGNSLMKHCFIFNNDDALISNIGNNNTFRNCVVWKGPYGRCMISLQNNSQSTLLWEDIDIIGNESLLGNLKGKTIAIIETTAGIKQNFTFRNIRIEGQAADKAGLIYIDSEGSSEIKNIYLDNITTELLRTSAVNTEGTINQATGGRIDGIHFKCVKMDGALINSLTDAHVQMTGGVLNIDFDNTSCTNTLIKKVCDNNKLRVYSNQYNKLQVDLDDIKIKNISLFNSIGNNVKSGRLTDIEVSNLPVGVYIVQAEAEGIHYFCKFIKQ